jgi:hypothetical protein
LLICSEMFGVGTSTVSKMLRDTIHAINEVVRHEIAWLVGFKLVETQNDFKDLCGLPRVVGTIDGTHTRIRKP